MFSMDPRGVFASPGIREVHDMNPRDGGRRQDDDWLVRIERPRTDAHGVPFDTNPRMMRGSFGSRLGAGETLGDRGLRSAL